jgi:Zn-dependent peptidase ImmA (M78 family)/transcriptional regulator with XRE-family HTH domain
MGANGEMLRLARQLKGFQQTEAAKRLGIEQPILSRIEHGLADAPADVLIRAAQVYDLPKSFFDLTDPVYGAPVSVHPMWRRKADVTARELDTVVAEMNVRVMHLRRLFEGADVAHSSDIPRMDIEDYGDARKIAGLVRAHWRVSRGPLPDLTRLVERAGAIVVHSRLGGASISGVTFATPGMSPLIVLNSEQPADRMRFTLAHELGHLVMHRFPTPGMEEEANAFASALLLPAADILPALKARRIELSTLAALKPEWRVSMQALLMSASELLPLDIHRKQYLWKQMSARGYRLREPPEADFEKEQPTIVASLLDVHLNALGYSADDLAKLLHVHSSGFSDYYPSENTRKNKITILK